MQFVDYLFIVLIMVIILPCLHILCLIGFDKFIENFFNRAKL
jgi:hypothetical protein